MGSLVDKRFAQCMDILAATSERLAGRIEQAAGVIVDSLAGGGGLFVLGNGGSAADAQHIAGELVGRFMLDRKPLRAEALTTDSSILTSVGNDMGFDEIFARQVRGKCRPGDVVLVLSTSGDSPNVLAALTAAREIPAATIAMTGPGGGRCGELADILLDVPLADTSPRIQEAHCLIYHIICELVEAGMADDR